MLPPLDPQPCSPVKCMQLKDFSYSLISSQKEKVQGQWAKVASWPVLCHPSPASPTSTHPCHLKQPTQVLGFTNPRFQEDSGQQ